MIIILEDDAVYASNASDFYENDPNRRYITKTYRAQGLLTRRDELSRILREIRRDLDAAQTAAIPKNGTDMVIHPVDMPFETYRNLTEIWPSVSSLPCRLISRSVADAYIFAKDLIQSEHQTNCFMLSEYNGRVEFLSFDCGDRVMEVMENDVYQGISSLENSRLLSEGTVTQFFLVGSVPDSVEREAAEWASRHSARIVRKEPVTLDAQVSSGYWRVPCGFAEPLILDTLKFDIGLRLRNNQYMEIIPRDTTIPTRKTVTVPWEDLPNQELQFCFGTSRRGFSGQSISLQHFTPKKEITLTVAVNAITEFSFTAETASKKVMPFGILNLKPEIDERHGAADLDIFRLIDVLDDLERSRSYAESSGDAGMAKGIRIIEEKVEKLLEEQGVSAIRAVGEPFSPKWHNAVEHVSDSRVPENTVIREYRRGYVKDGRVLRYSNVVVAN